MVTANFPWRVTWGKDKKYEDRFSSKLSAEKAAKELKLRKEKFGGKAYHNVRVGKVR